MKPKDAKELQKAIKEKYPDATKEERKEIYNATKKDFAELLKEWT